MDHPPILVIFDFDNTVIDSRINFPELRSALVALLASSGALPAPREALLRQPIRDIVEHAAALAPELLPTMWAAIERFEADGLKDAAAMPHAAEVLEALGARGYRLALLTNNARAATAGLLERLGLAAAFDLIVTRDDVPAIKPDPAGVRLILDRLGPAAAFLVGDSWIDGLAARQAGIRFVGFGPRRAEVEARGVMPWAWVVDLRELLDLD